MPSSNSIIQEWNNRSPSIMSTFQIFNYINKFQATCDFTLKVLGWDRYKVFLCTFIQFSNTWVIWYLIIFILFLSLLFFFYKGASWARTPWGLPGSSNPWGSSCCTTTLRAALHDQRSCAGAPQTTPCSRTQRFCWPHTFLVFHQRPSFLLFFLILQSTAVPASAIPACAKVHHHCGGPGHGIRGRVCSCGEGRTKFRGSLFKQKCPVTQCQTLQPWQSNQGTVRKVCKQLLRNWRKRDKWHVWESK